MNLRLALAESYCPAPLKRRVLRDLFSATAQAFGVRTPPSGRLSPERLLIAYAQFTKAEAERLWAESGDEKEVERRLFENARVLGAALRRKFRARSRNEVIRLSRLLYKILGIGFECRDDGGVTIRQCGFSRCYTERVCRLISALDAGAASGLTGGGTLEFTQRITEGHNCCCARLIFPEGIS
jgi:hypothetical protein